MTVDPDVDAVVVVVSEKKARCRVAEIRAFELTPRVADAHPHAFAIQESIPAFLRVHGVTREQGLVHADSQ